MKKRNRILAVFFAAVLAATPQAIAYAGAALDGKTDAEASYGESFTSWKTDSWENGLSSDWTQVAMTPGADETSMDFAWYAKSGDETSLVYGQKADLSDGQSVEVTSVDTGRTDKSGITYTSNKAVITGLAAGTTYYYQVKGKAVHSFTTGTADQFSFAFVGDPQIGSSNEIKGQATAEFYNAQSNAVANDSYNWTQTLNKIQNSGADFVVSAGDQIQTTAKKSPEKDKTTSEIEYAGYLSPAALTALPVATTVGNHDADNENYTYHFNLPNMSNLGDNGKVGGDYYFTYNGVLFMMLNTQDTNSAEHIEFIQNTVEKNSDCKWKVVTLHQDIYGSAEHSNEPEIVNLRYALTPAFEKYGVDVVLTGHDHAYSRSKFLSGDQAVNQTEYTDDEFDAMLKKDVDYSGEGTVTTAPGNIKDDTTDELEKSYLTYLKSIMDDSRITEDTEYAVDPKGILYLTAGSSSGSKYYDLVARKQSYIANRWQEDVPTYSMIDVTETTMTINTYRTDNDSNIDNTVTIVKTADQSELSAKVKEIQSEIANGTLAEKDYTESSWAALQDELTAAQALDEKATQSQINLAVEKLAAARSGLEKKQSVNPAPNPGSTEETDKKNESGQNEQQPDKNGAGEQTEAKQTGADTKNGKNNASDTTKNTVTSTVKTGDTMNAAGWTFACVAGLGAIGAGVILRRKNEKKREQ